MPNGLAMSIRRTQMSEAAAAGLFWLMLFGYVALCVGAILLIELALFFIGCALFDFCAFIKEKIEDYIDYVRDIFHL